MKYFDWQMRVGIFCEIISHNGPLLPIKSDKRAANASQVQSSPGKSQLTENFKSNLKHTDAAVASYIQWPLN